MGRDIYYGAELIKKLTGVELTNEQMVDSEVRKALYGLAVGRNVDKSDVEAAMKNFWRPGNLKR